MVSRSCGSTARASPAGPRSPSRSCCGSRQPACPWRSCDRATTCARRSAWSRPREEPFVRRTALVYLLPATIVASAWLRLEDPSGGGQDALWIVLLALVPALLPTLALRLFATGPVVLVAAWLALD